MWVFPFPSGCFGDVFDLVLHYSRGKVVLFFFCLDVNCAFLNISMRPLICSGTSSALSFAHFLCWSQRWNVDFQPTLGVSVLMARQDAERLVETVTGWNPPSPLSVGLKVWSGRSGIDRLVWWTCLCLIAGRWLYFLVFAVSLFLSHLKMGALLFTQHRHLTSNSLLLLMWHLC